MTAPVSGLRHLALLTRNLEKTRRFYVETLGLKEAFEHKGMIFLETPGGDDIINFIATRGRLAPRRGGLDHFGFHVSARRWRSVLARPHPRPARPLRRLHPRSQRLHGGALSGLNDYATF